MLLPDIEEPLGAKDAALYRAADFESIYADAADAAPWFRDFSRQRLYNRFAAIATRRRAVGAAHCHVIPLHGRNIRIALADSVKVFTFRRYRLHYRAYTLAAFAATTAAAGFQAPSPHYRSQITDYDFGHTDGMRLLMHT